jgi:hypothetical protein
MNQRGASADQASLHPAPGVGTARGRPTIQRVRSTEGSATPGRPEILGVIGNRTAGKPERRAAGIEPGRTHHHSRCSEAACKSSNAAALCSIAIALCSRARPTSARTRNLWSAAFAGSTVSSLAAPAAFAPGSSCGGAGRIFSSGRRTARRALSPSLISSHSSSLSTASLSASR